MVTRLDTGKLMKISEIITYVNGVCQTRNLGVMMPRPKDERGGILFPLQQGVEMLNQLFDEKHELHWIQAEFETWISKIDSAYRKGLITSEVLSKKWSLDYDDSKNLEGSTLKWIKALHDYFEKSSLTILNDEAINRIHKELSEKLDPTAKDDLNDAIVAIQSELPNPAVMILNRVAESVIRKFYQRIMKDYPKEKDTWGDLVNVLEQKLEKNDPLIHLLHYRRGNRNTAQHPGKRYSPEEAEQTLMAVKELIDVIQSFLEPFTIFDYIPKECVGCGSKKISHLEGFKMDDVERRNRTCRDCGIIMILKEGIE